MKFELQVGKGKMKREPKVGSSAGREPSAVLAHFCVESAANPQSARRLHWAEKADSGGAAELEGKRGMPRAAVVTPLLPVGTERQVRTYYEYSVGKCCCHHLPVVARNLQVDR